MSTLRRQISEVGASAVCFGALPADLWMLTFVAGLVTILEYGQAMHGKTIDEVVRD